MTYAFDIEATVLAEQKTLADLKAEALASGLSDRQRAFILAQCSCDRIWAETTRATLRLLETSQDPNFTAGVMGSVLGCVLRNVIASTDARTLLINLNRALCQEGDHTAETQTVNARVGRA